jgi:hypothetical protein
MIPHLVNISIEENTVGPGKVDEFKDALGRMGWGKRFIRCHTGLVDEDDLSGFNLSLKLGTDQVESAGFRSDDRRILEPPQDKRPETKRITHGDHLLLAGKSKEYALRPGGEPESPVRQRSSPLNGR